jgi:hypothetical protein
MTIANRRDFEPGDRVAVYRNTWQGKVGWVIAIAPDIWDGLVCLWLNSRVSAVLICREDLCFIVEESDDEYDRYNNEVDLTGLSDREDGVHVA